MRTQIILVFAGFLISLSQAQVATPVAATPACPSDCIVPCVTYQLSNTCLERCGCTQAQADEAVKKAQTPAAAIQPTPVVAATPAQPVTAQPVAAPAQNSFLSSFLEPAKGYLGATPAAAPASGTPASATPATGAPIGAAAQGGFNFSDLSTLLDKFKSQNAPPQNTQESLTAALTSQPLGQYAVTSEPDGRYTLIPIGGSGIIQVNVTKNESTYTTSANANEQIAVVCSGAKSSCLGLSFADGVLKGVKNVSVTSETGPVKMVTVSEPVTSAPVATPVVAPVATPVATPVTPPVAAPVVDAPVGVPVDAPVVSPVAEASPVPVVESVAAPVVEATLVVVADSLNIFFRRVRVDQLVLSHLDYPHPLRPRCCLNQMHILN